MYPFSIFTVSSTLTWSICSFHRVSFIVPVSSLIMASATRYVSFLYLERTSRVSDFSITFASTSTLLSPSFRSLIFRILPPVSFNFFRDFLPRFQWYTLERRGVVFPFSPCCRSRFLWKPSRHLLFRPLSRNQPPKQNQPRRQNDLRVAPFCLASDDERVLMLDISFAT
jgi:hypothetical protein